MINDYGLVITKPKGKFHKQPLLSGLLFLEQNNDCPLQTHFGHYFSDIVICQSLISINIMYLLDIRHYNTTFYLMDTVREIQIMAIRDDIIMSHTEPLNYYFEMKCL